MTQRESMPMWLGTMSLDEADAARPRPIAQVLVRLLATEVAGDPVVVERVGGGDRVGLAAQALDPLRRLRALPQPDEPQAGHAPRGERVELLVRDPVERPDVAAVHRATAGPARRTCSSPSARPAASRRSPTRTPRVPPPRHRMTASRPAARLAPRRRRRPLRHRTAGGARVPPRPGCRPRCRDDGSGRRARCPGCRPSWHG